MIKKNQLNKLTIILYTKFFVNYFAPGYYKEQNLLVWLDDVSLVNIVTTKSTYVPDKPFQVLMKY